MARAWQLVVKATGQTADGKRAFRDLKKASRDFQRAVGVDFGRVARASGMALGAGLAATAAVGIRKLNETQKSMAQTRAVLKSTGGVANVSAKQIASMADAIASKTGVDDDAIQAGQNMLLTFTKIRNEAGRGNDIFNQATGIMTDYAVAMGTEPKQAAIQLGKALNDPVRGITALGRAGVQFTDQQKEQIKTLVESGDTLGAQKLILKELETQFGGSADAYGKTLGGQLSILKQDFEVMAEAIVVRVVPSLTAAMGKARELAAAVRGWAQTKEGQAALDRVRSFAEKAGDVVQELVEFAGRFARKMYEWRDVLIPVAAGIGAIIVALRTWRIVTAAVALAQAALNVVLAANPIGLVILAVVGLVAAIMVLWKRNEGFRNLVKKVWGAVAGWIKGAWQWIKKTAAAIGPGIKSALSSMWRAIKPVLLWVWDKFKAIGREVIRLYGTYLKGVWAVLKTLWAIAKPILAKLIQSFVNIILKVRGWYSWVWDKIKPALEWLKDKGASALDGIKKGFDKLKGVVKPVADFIGKIKDGVGWLKDKGGSALSWAMPGGGFGDGAGVGPLAGVDSFTPIAQRFGLMMTSAHRPGDPGYHGQNRARDYSNGFGPTPQMLRFAKFLAAVYGRQLKELIYTPLGFGIKNGVKVPLEFFGDRVNQMHNNHVHVAYARGGIVTRPHIGLVGEAGPEAIIPLGNSRRARMDRDRLIQQAGIGGGGPTYNVHIEGYEPEQVWSVLQRKVRMTQPAVSY